MFKKKLIILIVMGLTFIFAFASHALTTLPLFIPIDNYFSQMYRIDDKCDNDFNASANNYYQFSRYFAVELGTFYTLMSKFSSDRLTVPETNIKIHSSNPYSRHKCVCQSLKK